MNNIQKLLELDKEIKILGGMIEFLSWDQMVLMPEKAIRGRGEQLSLIKVLLHDRLANQMPKLLSAKPRNAIESKIIERYKWLCERAAKLPKSYIQELAKTLPASHHAWEKAKKSSDFSIWKPHLEKVVALKRKEAQYLMPKIKIHPYECLMQDYERGLTVKEVDRIFSELKKGLMEIIKKCKKQKRPSLEISPDVQKEILIDIATMILQDKDKFLISTSVHPFMATISHNDYRLTTAIREDPFFSISSTAHESGHALYESQIDEKYAGTILQEGTGLGLHESQSRIWENQIVRSMEFWKFYHNKLMKTHPEIAKKHSVEDFYANMNNVKMTPIRIESDELTYCLHIIIRYELEKGLIEGSIEVKDLPKLWNAKYKEYLGIDIKNDGEGVLQDTHWSEGWIGYFSTYALGSIYSAMIYAQMKKDFDLDRDVSQGNFDRIREWLRKNIHQYGHFYSTSEVIQKACGSGLDIKPFLKYLEEKYC